LNKNTQGNVILSYEQSINLICALVKKGKELAQVAIGKSVIIIIGATGAGKTTIGNSLLGVKFRYISLKEAQDLGLEKWGMQLQEGQQEKLKIGHYNSSMTILAEGINIPNTDYVMFDCAGFLDNRGEQINIANNAILMAIIANAKDVRILMTGSYYELRATRGGSFRSMIETTAEMFGGIKTLIKMKQSFYIMVTHIMLDEQIHESEI